MTTLRVDSVSKTFRQDFWGKPVRAVNDLSFTLDSAAITGFVGPNGAGKTTTIKMILGLVRPDRGAVTIDTKSAADPACRRSVGFVSEQPYFYDYLSVLETLHFLGQLRGIDQKALSRQIPEVLDRLDLSEHRSKKVRALSKGNQQRLNFAQALLGDPALFILDEPMSGLDPLGRRLFREVFRDLASRGKTIFFSTHILEDIEQLCERVLVLSRGKRVYDGPIATLLEAGFTGTELTVAKLGVEARAHLGSVSCTITDSFEGLSTIMVPKGADPLIVQRWLADHGLFCTSIIRRTGSLESMLYQDTSLIESL